jgi:nitrogen fixation protein NifX
MSSQNTLTRELALRIGLAARALPDTDAKRLFAVLTDCVGLPITEDKLGHLNLKAFKSAQGGELSGLDDASLKSALQVLKHQVEAEGTLKPVALDYSDGDMPGSVRIAVASDDYKNVNGHFGSCNQFMIYQVSAEEIRLIALRETAIPAGLEVDDKNVYRAELIQDCKVLYLTSVGGPAAAKIVKLGIHPIKLPSAEPINEVLGKLQGVIAGTPPPWLAKAMGVESADRFRFEKEATG